MITGQGIGAGAVAELPQPQHRLPEAGQRPAAPGRPASPALDRQQRRGELGDFPGTSSVARRRSRGVLQ